MAMILSCLIEDIPQFHPDLELTPMILSAVSVMRKYSKSPSAFHLECQNIVSALLRGTEANHIQVHWRKETELRADRQKRTFQQKRLVEDGAIGIACILFPKVVYLSGLEATNFGDRGDYWINRRQYMVEISGTERASEFRRRHRQKIRQMLSNPYQKDGYVVVCDFFSQRILFSFHRQEAETTMSQNNSPTVPFPDSNKVDKLAAKKTNLLWQARRKMDEGLIAEAKVLYEETAQYEEQLARLLEVAAPPVDVVISLASAASCYMKAEQYELASQLFDRALLKDITPELRRELEKLKRKCLQAQKKPSQTSSLPGKIEPR
ncbi:hypothetical protein HYR99_02970 [Candidatus Poribacteria bacterium]|nr:hypothetical protein [Candidatus Poribacteria bacterium]